VPAQHEDQLIEAGRSAPSYGNMYMPLTIKRATIVNIQVAIMTLYLPKNERIVIIRRARLVTKEPIKKGLISTKVKALAE